MRPSVSPAPAPDRQPPRVLQSIVNGSLFHFYIFRLYFEQILLDEDQVETRLRLHRTLATVVPSPLFVENRESDAVLSVFFPGIYTPLFQAPFWRR